jgi:hypothetical protein
VVVPEPTAREAYDSTFQDYRGGLGGVGDHAQGQAMDQAATNYQAQTDQFFREMDRHRSLKIMNPAAYAKVDRAARQKYGIGEGPGYYGTLFRNAGR